jgi:NADH:ubiquinone oxidoreductase subunit 6 (subunit J)
MMTPKTQTTIATTTIALTASITIALIPTKPDASTAVLVFLAIMVAVWNGTKFLVKRKCTDVDWLNSRHRHEILFAIILASLLLLGAMIATVAKQLELLDGDVIKRIIGMNTGLMLIVLGNYMPKKNQAAASQCGCASKPTSNNIQRFIGWTFVLGGLLYTGAWIVFDLDQAGIAILFAFPGAIAIILAARFAYLRFSNTKSTPTQSV